ncbi:MAG: UDP-N-acetylmuramoyl-L-alanyl-D-glutamate--2,6-diaminopimelate ligase, partial [Clostridia bacterium]|nr:UDP-N-acetylmuramoyl-L-alanyl-D-glutamate--2,6-diaminopimelate ligase [Clostridia bacterium]
TERLLEELPDDAIQVCVRDTRKEHAVVSAVLRGHPAYSLHVIGVTGTKGKTTTALLIRSILSGAGVHCAYIGSNGVIINGEHIDSPNTTPESCELQKYFRMMIDAGVRYVALEVSSQALDHFRVYGIPFDVAVFTNLYRDHIGEGEHSSFEEYKAAKTKLFTDYKKNLTVTNLDDPNSDSVTGGDAVTPRLSYSISDPRADYYADQIKPFRDSTSLGISFLCHHGEETVPIKLKSPGKFSVSNALAAVASVAKYGIDLKTAAKILSDTTVTGRFEVVDGLEGRTFIIDYAHNGISLESALSVLREYSPERIICVYGSVGGRTRERRRELAEAASQYADYSIITSDNPDFEPPSVIADEIASYLKKEAKYEIITDRDEAVRRAVRISREGDVVLFAGKGHERYQLIEGVKVPFSERSIIEEECEAIRREEMKTRISEKIK